MNVNILFVIGGDGSMHAAKAIGTETAARGRKISVIGIPKTIDNDINFISRSFGFDTAVEKATEAIQCAHVEATGVDKGVGLVKLMGREAGFIAAQATLAMQEVNFLLVPEQPFVMEGETGLLAAIERRLRRRSHAVIVCAEGRGPGPGLLRDQTRRLGKSQARRYLRVPVQGDQEVFQEAESRDLHEIHRPQLTSSAPCPPMRATASTAASWGKTRSMRPWPGKRAWSSPSSSPAWSTFPWSSWAVKRRNLNPESDYWCSVMGGHRAAGLL